ncbi:histidine phosphatase family protein [Lottiidibacillus patelloidae]|uniref:Histidine phosphatase family protein n=1 Tax=Lottiidibacillus patelloidae TaxID=2670334 RepID=A0A263BWZ4_9BACI|nr:histidine phosphatase family protein [Lottiidibacillus patelloidae]OZM58082.1 histidine phosphatase family protein [Lottiidibacillus patelloidae]
MNKEIYIVRHCAAEGQPADANLTDIGMKQAKKLADYFVDKNVGRIFSSPYVRAIQSVKPLASMKGIEIEVDERLAERTLSTENLADWMEKLRETYVNLQLKLPGGESSSEAMERAVAVIEDIKINETTLIASHGNLISLLLKYYDPAFGFTEWKELSNPDVFLLKITEGNEGDFERIWNNPDS